MEKDADSEKRQFLLERREAFSQSLLWELQRRYYAERGVDAWRQGEVPHYVTSNPTVANSYAEIVLALLQDNRRQNGAGGTTDDPFLICELGAGSGRFAFHFLSRLSRLCEEADVALESFRYVLTDHAESNLQFWRQHLRFAPLFDKGLLDVAVFDVTRSDEIVLQRRGERIGVGDLRRPLTVIANYVFDSIPQDLFALSQSETGESQIEECRVSLIVDADPNTLDIAELLQRVQCQFHREPLTGSYYPEPALQAILEEYGRTLRRTHLLFPATALRCLQRLKALSQEGLLLLSADKGEHRLPALENRPAPRLVRHGSFSFNVNYHAVREFVERDGGMALFPDTTPRSLIISASLLVANPTDYRETRRAYQHQVRDFSPEDFFTIVRHADGTVGAMSAEEILAYLRLSRYDSQQFSRCLDRLTELAPEFAPDQQEAVLDAIERVRELHFSLGEELILTNAIAGLLYAMGEYRRALDLCAHSLQSFGPNPGTLANMALCHYLLGDRERAEELAHQVLAETPDNEAALALLAEIAAN